MTELSQVGEARRCATQVVRALGFSETDTGRVALVVTEAATNLVKHATGGQLLVGPLRGSQGLELLALDTGPGMRHVSECLRDGYSTAGSPGTGLGAITRLVTLWDIYSVAGMGTALLMQIMPSSASASPHHLRYAAPQGQYAPAPLSPTGGQRRRLEIGVVCVPKAGEIVCGDAYAEVQQDGGCLVMVSDGLGHGPDAAEASQAAVRVVYEHSTEGPAVLLERMHGSLRHTRGAAVAVAEVNFRRQEVVFAGVGNIAGRVIVAEKTPYVMSHNGIVGHQMRKVQAQTYPWSDNALLVLHSDGLATRWDLTAYPGLARRHSSVIAGVLYRNFTRGYDDVIVVVARTASG